MIRRNVWPLFPAVFCLLAISAAVSASPKYVGVNGCRNCHKAQFSSWEMSTHAKAFELLQPGVRKGAKKRGGLDPEKDYTTDEKCLKCHTTGYGKEGGFTDLATTPTLAGVVCEACHGAGSEYRVLHDENPTFKKDANKAKGATYGGEDPEVCKACHESEDNVFTEQIDPKYKFNWEERLQKRESFHLKQDNSMQFRKFSF